MNLLKRYESDDFDESYSFDDAEYGDFEESGSSKPFLVKAIAMILAVTGIAYGANIALTASGTRSEFGQGILTTTACDTNGGITVIPYAGFTNETGTPGASGEFTLDSIILENIDAACVGDVFTIQVYAETGTALNVSESATAPNGGSYRVYDLATFFFKDSATVEAIDSSYIDFAILHDVTNSEFADNQSSIQIAFDNDRLISFADSQMVRRITIQTTKR
jgi:hypothetical protein